MRTAATRLEPFIFRLERSHSEIRNLQSKMVVQQQILRFQVTMTDPERMEIVDSVDKLLKEKGRLIRLQKSFGVDVVKQFALSDVLQRDVARKKDVQTQGEHIRAHNSQMSPQLIDVIELH